MGLFLFRVFLKRFQFFGNDDEFVLDAFYGFTLTFDFNFRFLVKFLFTAKTRENKFISNKARGKCSSEIQNNTTNYKRKGSVPPWSVDEARRRSGSRKVTDKGVQVISTMPNTTPKQDYTYTHYERVELWSVTQMVLDFVFNLHILQYSK